MPALHTQRPVFGHDGRLGSGRPQQVQGRRCVAVVKAQSASTSTAPVDKDQPAWTGDTLASKFVNWLINNKPLYGMMKVMAKNTMKSSARERGIDWDLYVQQLRSNPQLLTIQKELENPNLPYPDYYLKPFHAYETGNLEWLAAYEVEPATYAMGIRTFKDKTEWDAQQCLVELRTRITDTMKGYLAQHQLASPSRIIDMGCSTGISTRWLARQFPDAKEIIGLDASSYMLSVAELDRRNNTGAASVPASVPTAPIRYVHALVEQNGLPAGSQHMVCYNFISHECPQQALRDFCGEAHRLLAARGVVVFVDNNPRSKTIQNLPPVIMTLMKSTEPWSDEYYSFDLEQGLRDAGFKEVVTFETDHRHRCVMGIKA